MSRWTYRSVMVLAVAWMLAWGTGCPDEPTVESAPAPGEGMAPPPPQAGEMPPGGEAPAGGALGAENEKPVAAGEKGTEGTQEKQEEESTGGDAASASSEEGPAPGPGGEKFGGPDGIPFTPFPPNILTQDEIKKGDAVKFKGMVSGDRCKSHKVRIEIMTVQDGKPSLITMKVKNGIGSYEILVPKGDSKLWVTAVCDVNGNNKIDIDKDWVGAYTSNPVVATEGKTGVAIKLQKPTESLPKGFPPIKNQKPPK